MHGEISTQINVLPPFKYFCSTIGELPTSYLESMSYYETIVWLCNYLKETIIPTVNNTGNAVTELQNLYIQLQNYVNTYFDNLDVQEEINNKLDEMVTTGELQGLLSELYNNLRNEINDTIETFENTTNNNIIDLTARINGVASGRPIPVSSISQMIDTTKIYLLTTDGYWYYYNGSNWVQGDIYQSTGIANDSIDILSLDTNLRSNFSIKQTKSNITPEQTLSGWCRVVNNELSIETGSSQYEYKIFALENNTIYDFYLWQIYSIDGLIIVDSADNNKVLYHSRTSDGTASPEFVTDIFKTPVNGTIKAYMSYTTTNTSSGNPWYLTRFGVITKYNDIQLNKNYYNSVDLIETNSTALMPATTNSTIYPQYVATNYEVKQYSLKNSYTYSFHYIDYYSMAGLVITDKDFNVLYISSTENIGDNFHEGDYTYTATQDCYAFLSRKTNTTYIPSIELILTENLQDKIGFNKWYAIGDSITEVNFRALHNYLYWTKQDISQLEIVNLGVSGTGYKKESGNGNNTFINRLDLINSYDLNNNIITVMGSINDMNYITNYLGELGDTTTDTLYGSMYVFFNTLFTKFNGVRVGCISPLNWKNSGEELELYNKALKETCELFNIPFLDISKETNLRPKNENFLNTYYIADGTGSSGQLDSAGVHPNSLGHKLFYGRIKEFIKYL